MKSKRFFESPDGTRWGVEVEMPSASNAMLVFHHPVGRTARLDRYAWHNSHRPEASDVTARLDKKSVLDSLSDDDVARLFRRSMPISAADTPLDTPVTHVGA
ncbi:MAG: hypothetical protein WKG32_23075 [Gemmatimonadaceae bacterium]